MPREGAASGTGSRRKGSFSAAGRGKNAFHRRRPMTCRGRRQMGVKRKHRSGPSRRATARHATPISGPPAHGRAFAAQPAGCARIADLPGITEPKVWSLFSRVIPRKSPYPADRHEVEARARAGGKDMDAARRHQADHSRQDPVYVRDPRSASWVPTVWRNRCAVTVARPSASTKPAALQASRSE